ncbi:hypothetical protein DL96DRAFT_1583755 [Flagelloscypha sp. PMI_526]|nr:hypothetical protein DL96DRAFT_1583755 [Flagelloscypha sp. PMI_526]
MSDRTRKKDKLSKLAELKRVREGGKRVFQDEDVDLYDEVSEDQYKSIVKGRLQRDDFVVDDGVDGYMDDGMDDWDERENYSDEEVDSRKAQKSKGKGKKTQAKPKKPPPPVTSDISAYKPVKSAEEEDNFMSNLLSTMDEDPPEVFVPRPVPRKRKLSPESSPVRGTDYRSDGPSSDGPYEDSFPAPSSDDAYPMSPAKKAKHDHGFAPAVDQFANLAMKSGGTSDASFEFVDDDIDMDAFDTLADDDLVDLKPKIEGIKPSPSPVKPVEAKKKWLDVFDTLNVAEESTLGSNTASFSHDDASVLEEDGSLRFFWLDCLEERGKLYFTGKLKEKTSGLWISCCVTVENMQRNLFLLPWDQIQQVVDEELVSTDEVPTYDTIYEDFDQLRSSLNISSFMAKEVQRKYAFGEEEVPREATTWIKVLYSFEDGEIPSSAWTTNIRRIFGTNTSAFELLVLKRKIMGPCWLQIKKPEIEFKGISWCKVEATVSDPKDINPFSDNDESAPKEMPPLNIVSLSLSNLVNHELDKREIVCASVRTWQNVNIDDPTPADRLPCTVHSYVRPLGGKFPAGFESAAKKSTKGTITTAPLERPMLNQLLAALYKADPDVIVGHDFLGVHLDVLLQRLKELKCDNWSRIGRFRRKKWPIISKQGRNLHFLSGRLLCDLASDGAKSMIASTTWSMTEMVKSHLGIERDEIDPNDIFKYFDPDMSSADQLMSFVRQTELDAHFQMAIGSKVQILPLTKQLTNLAGNSWNKTLNGGRAERNEYILLHEFHRLKFICPNKEKVFVKKKATTSAPELDENGVKITKAKRDKYKGGLVLEPKRGLHDKFILVMDFNSLYPSIIQEYNIDFTTVDPVDREDQDDEIREPPDSGTPKGVLPRIIATLVQRRRAVKSLMKDKKISASTLMQYDIKQQALKLTANSMYGCLGFEYSRFYARPLAALTTYKGRQILTHTKELAESLNLDVVYGDTDSVFVNSGVSSLPEALKVSSEFKKAVNECYKLLEIDLDGVFQRLLLLQKKKYAALKVEDAGKSSVEVKGLDMKRREYSALSKRVSQFVLDKILSGEDKDAVVSAIHDYLTKIGQDVRDGKVSLDEFIIHKRLGKAPEDYPDAKSQPHVQVALKMKAKDRQVRAGDVISYVFCLSEGQETSKTGQADRAFHPDDLRKGDTPLKIDFEFYLSNQVLPPIERLCDPIEGTDKTRLAECLGLDPARYRTSTYTTFEEHAFSSLDSQMSNRERFKDADRFRVRCRACQVQVEWKTPYEDEPTISLQNPSTGPVCSNMDCRKPLSLATLQTLLDIQIRTYISQYYEHRTICQDPTCANISRTVFSVGRRCLKPHCGNEVSVMYTDAMLYTQLRYFSSLFNPTLVVDSAPITQKGLSHFQLV